MDQWADLQMEQAREELAYKRPKLRVMAHEAFRDSLASKFRGRKEKPADILVRLKEHLRNEEMAGRVSRKERSYAVSKGASLVILVKMFLSDLYPVVPQ